MFGGRSAACEDSPGAALSGGGVQGHQAVAAVHGGQDVWEVTAGRATARLQDTFRCLHGDRKVAGLVAPGRLPHRRGDGDKRAAEEVGDVGYSGGDGLQEVSLLLSPVEELFTGKSIANPIKIERARFAALQQNVRQLHDDLNKEQDKLDLLALAGVINSKARHIADFNAASVGLVSPRRWWRRGPRHTVEF